MYTNAKMRIYPVGIYLLKVNNENSRTRFIICSKLTKKETHNALQLPVFFYFLFFLVFLPALSRKSGNSEQKIILQAIEQLIQFNYLLL